MEEPAISVIIPARDAAGTLALTLGALSRQRLDVPFEVVVVDNGSGDETAELAQRHPLAPRVVRRRRGEGPGAARNDGVAVSRGPALAFVDSDCEPTESWLAEGLRALSQADLVAGAVRPSPGVAVGPFDRTLWVEREHGLYETANMFVRRDWFERLGGFQDWVPDRGVDGAPGRPFGEDAWFAWRARRLGARTAFEERALVHHVVFPGTARDAIVEQWRLRHFPALVARIPELRDVFAWRRWFLNRRTAAFDLALAFAIGAVLFRSPWPLAAAAPYAALVSKEARNRGGRGPAMARIAAAITASDAVGCAALVLGSLRARAALL